MPTIDPMPATSATERTPYARQLTPRQLDLCRQFISGDIEIIEHAALPSEGLSERYWLKISGRFVVPAGMPDGGYLSHGDAVDGAQRFKAACRRMLNGTAP